MQAEVIKLNLIRYIMEIADTSKLKKMDLVIRNIKKSESKIDLKKFAKPMRDYLDVEELKKEQNFKPIDKNDFFEKIKKLKIEEPIEGLLEMI
jgi:hypothetical protein